MQFYLIYVFLICQHVTIDWKKNFFELVSHYNELFVE